MAYACLQSTTRRAVVFGAVTSNLMFARLLVVTDVDVRAPRSLRHLNQSGVPFGAVTFQVAFTVEIVGHPHLACALGDSELPD